MIIDIGGLMNKTILITGANRGIGLALTKFCLSKNFMLKHVVEIQIILMN